MDARRRRVGGLPLNDLFRAPIGDRRASFPCRAAAGSPILSQVKRPTAALPELRHTAGAGRACGCCVPGRLPAWVVVLVAVLQRRATEALGHDTSFTTLNSDHAQDRRAPGRMPYPVTSRQGRPRKNCCEAASTASVLRSQAAPHSPLGTPTRHPNPPSLFRVPATYCLARP
jgi:hypothetical protein